MNNKELSKKLAESIIDYRYLSVKSWEEVIFSILESEDENLLPEYPDINTNILAKTLFNIVLDNKINWHIIKENSLEHKSWELLFETYIINSIKSEYYGKFHKKNCPLIHDDIDTRKDMGFRGKYVKDVNELGEQSNEFSNLRFEGE